MLGIGAHRVGIGLKNYHFMNSMNITMELLYMAKGSFIIPQFKAIFLNCQWNCVGN